PSAASDIFCAPSSLAVRLSLGSTRGAAIRLLAVEAASLSARGCCGTATGISEIIVVMMALPGSIAPSADRKDPGANSTRQTQSDVAPCTPNAACPAPVPAASGASLREDWSG